MEKYTYITEICVVLYCLQAAFFFYMRCLQRPGFTTLETIFYKNKITNCELWALSKYIPDLSQAVYNKQITHKASIFT